VSAKETILVVDDNELNRDVLVRMLRREGYVAIEAENGKRALEIIDAQDVHLVLLDEMMPEMSGSEVLTTLRKDLSNTELPVIMVTAKDDSDDIVGALERGANDYIVKPVNFAVALARIRATLKIRTEKRKRLQTGPVLVVLEPGTILDGRYRIDAELGSGGAGVVFKATHLELQREVAIKLLSSIAVDDVARFRSEGITACRVKHPNAVEVLDFANSDQLGPYLVMELLDGPSLDEYCKEKGKISIARCAEILVPVCRALAEAHRADVVHRDVKPSNIILHKTAAGEVPKVLDFGIAKFVGEAAMRQHQTQRGFVGTPAYMAPERFGHTKLSGRSDVYSVGIVAYEMLVGATPFAGGTSLMEMMSMHAVDQPEPLRKLVPELSHHIENLVMSALRKNPEDRPTAEQMADGLASVAD
jgi:DNA-binding response OmpR family regulator